ncbi:hypothetical protein Plec18167_003843 [Paecilomyces lecythidis]|uniref:Uncharacterized protein n=1 Tax=Paecilomyces lecythidis TaxID=3004212 RepID=A0ABR3XXH4_9EURO
MYNRSSFVEMLESQHSLVVKALQRLYKHCVNKEGFPGEPLVDVADGHPLTHAILDRLGLIKQAEEGTDEQSENNEEPLHSPQQLSTSTDYIGTVEPSPEPVSPRECTTTEFGSQVTPIPCKWDLPSMCTEQHGAYPRYDYLGQVPHATTADRLYQPPVVLSNASRCPDVYDQNDVCNVSSRISHLQHASTVPWLGPYQGPTQSSIDALSNYQLPLGQQPSYLVDSIGLPSGWAYPTEQ